MGLQKINNGHKKKNKLTRADVMILFVMKAPDQRKALAALGILYGPEVVKGMITYKKRFKLHQAWRDHLAAALNNAQEVVDGIKAKP